MEWLTIDIETRAGNPDAIEEWWRNFWKPDTNWKPETIGKRYLEGLDRKRQMGALLDSATIAVVAVAGTSKIAIEHCVGGAATTALPGKPADTDYGCVTGWASEREMLQEVDGLIRNCATEDTLLVGHNIKGFDLPRLRMAYVRNGLPMPPWLSHLQPCYDIMKEYCRGFSVERQELISFDDVMRGLGMESHKGIISGADIGRLIEAGDVETITRYASLDVQKESEAFLLMTGRTAPTGNNWASQQQRPTVGGMAP